MMKSHTRRRRRGATVVEFTLSLTVLVPLLIGTLVFGLSFTTTGATTEAQTLAGQFNLTSSGSSVVIFSTIQIETAAFCLAAVNNSNCPNLNQPVFVQQIAIGNTSANSSVFGTPTATGSLTATTGVSNNYSTTVSATAQANSPWAVATNFGSILTLAGGQEAYMAEMFNNTTGLSVAGLTGAPQVYSRAIF